MKNDVAQIKLQLTSKIREVLTFLLPYGIIKNGKFYVGDVAGNKGQSLVVEVAGDKIGLWHDFATGEGGDILDLWAQVRGFEYNFTDLCKDVQNWLGKSSAPIVPPQVSNKPTAKWHYTDEQGKIIATIFRYDIDGKKQYRPWDAITKQYKPPSVRPLYNLHNIKNAGKIIFVEGEKCADALIKLGITATTAMNGANAPLDKTDWLPLAGKQVVIWPDNDGVGKEFATKLAERIKNIGALSVSIIPIPPNKPNKWDAADAVEEGFNIKDFLKFSQKQYAVRELISAYQTEHLLKDIVKMPQDLISPRILTSEGTLVLGGAPKVGKTDFLINFMLHMAAGRPFLGMSPPKPLRVFYLQAEISYHYLRERLQKIVATQEHLAVAGKNLVITPQVKMLLDKEGIQKTINTINVQEWGGLVDVIVIDPLRNVFDGTDENDNIAMLSFLRNRLEVLREKTNPKAALLIAHHTKKIPKKMLEDDPFQALSGAGSLRGYYTSGIILHRLDEEKSPLKLFFELRNGERIAPQTIDKINGKWQLLQATNKLTTPTDSVRNKAIIALIISEAKQGRVYTSAGFAQSFAGRHHLGSTRTINDSIAQLSSQGIVQFFKNSDEYGLPPANRSAFGYMTVQGMTLGERQVHPTHKRCQITGNCVPFLQEGRVYE